VNQARSKLLQFIVSPFYDKVNRVELWLYRLKGALFYRHVFKFFGKKSAIYPPTLLGRPKFIHIGERVLIRNGVRLEAVLLDPLNPPEIYIGNNVTLEQDVHIVALGKVRIHDNATLAARVSLLCGNHPFFDIAGGPAKISDRLEGENSFIEIGAGTLVGIGSIIHMNVKIGEHVVVGANSVVKRSIPPYSAVDGNPAVVVLRYDVEEGRWQRPKPRP
jgi:acetyltransferase-like isoleucine patch superfamily enzyme